VATTTEGAQSGQARPFEGKGGGWRWGGEPLPVAPVRGRSRTDSFTNPTAADAERQNAVRYSMDADKRSWKSMQGVNEKL
jgi:hypothetical protein